MGNGVFSYEGKTDEWNGIRSITGMKFWDLTQNVVKYFYFAKMILWSNTKVKKGEAFLKISTDHAGINQDNVTDDLARIDYVRRLAEWNTKDIFRDLPIGIVLEWRKWVVYDTETATLDKEINKFFSYNPVENKEKFTNSKMSVAEIPLALHADIIDIELVCDGESSVELGWFFVAYMFQETSFTAIGNVLSVEDAFKL